LVHGLSLWVTVLTKLGLVVTGVAGAVCGKMGGQAEFETYVKFMDTVLIQNIVYNS
jgi:hypothetical protein